MRGVYAKSVPERLRFLSVELKEGREEKRLMIKDWRSITGESLDMSLIRTAKGDG
jgi:hypothetical protein